jgi:hypothetical protein
MRKSSPGVNRFSETLPADETSAIPQASASNGRIDGMPGS